MYIQRARSNMATLQQPGQTLSPNHHSVAKVKVNPTLLLDQFACILFPGMNPKANPLTCSLTYPMLCQPACQGSQ